MLIVNADDWGRSVEETDSTIRCFEHGTVSSTTAMMFMDDSERAARLALQAGIGVGLHLNLSQAFTGGKCAQGIRDDQKVIIRALTWSRFALLIYYPHLSQKLERVCHAQLEEFRRLYQREPTHVDGHQHMHLCTNLLLRPVFPPGIRMRRSFSFAAGEKGPVNRYYRARVDLALKKRFRLTDSFYCLGQQIRKDRARSAIELARSRSIVEIMTHPIVSMERDFLLSPGYSNLLRGLSPVSYVAV